MSGFADGIDAKAEGFGTILLAVMVDEQMVMLMIEDVLYVPSAGCNLFSPGLSLDQRFKMALENVATIVCNDERWSRASCENNMWTYWTHNTSNASS